MLDESTTAVPANPNVAVLIQRFQRQQEKKERWFQRGYQSGESWAVNLSSLEEFRRVAEEWDVDDWEDPLEDVDEDEFPTLHKALHESIDTWLHGDAAESGVERSLDSSGLGHPRLGKAARRDLDARSYMQGWQRAVKDLWQAAAPQLRQFRSV